MYDRLYKQEAEKMDRKKQSRKENKTGIPISMKTRFEEMSGYSFDDVRVHYSSSRPARFNALAYTQGNQVHIAPGQEKYLEHELGHVVQQKEGRVKPTFRIGNVPVNDDKALEQEADVRLHSNQGFEPTERNTYRGPDVLQGQFIKGNITIKPYCQKMGLIFNNFLHTVVELENNLAIGIKLISQYDDFNNNSEFCENLDNIFHKIYQPIRQIAKTDKERERDFARLDILKDMIDHCKTQKYTHYHMYGENVFLCDDNTQGEGNSRNNPAQPLNSAIDCKITEINVPSKSLEKVLWIESFVSFQKGAGKILLKELISGFKSDEIEYVALGAYPKTEGYYNRELGMAKLEGAYILQDGENVVDTRDAIIAMGGNLEGQKEVIEPDKHPYIKDGLENCCLYPVYYIKKNELQEKLNR